MRFILEQVYFWKKKNYNKYYSSGATFPQIMAILYIIMC